MMSVLVCSGFVGSVVEVGGGLLGWYFLLCSFRARSKLKNMFGFVEHLQWVHQNKFDLLQRV